MVERLMTIVEEHRREARPLGVELDTKDISAIIDALRDHARGGAGAPVSGARDEIHSYCLDRLFEELVEEPSNIFFTTVTGPDSIRYEAMNVPFWIRCLNLMETTYAEE
ncbi:MAG: hypothetical protein AAF389_07495 [Gemmatimonadota bacterium]